MLSITQLVGRVKWFNNKAGYGFITITDGEQSGTDIFVHHSAINVENQQYKYLVQGEYVEFDLVKTESEVKDREWQASNVAGIKGGKLMCETRNELKLARSEYKTTKHSEEHIAEPKQKAAPKQRAVPKQKQTRQTQTVHDEDKKDWTLVNNSAPKKPRGRPPRENKST